MLPRLTIVWMLLLSLAACDDRSVASTCQIDADCPDELLCVAEQCIYDPIVPEPQPDPEPDAVDRCVQAGPYMTFFIEPSGEVPLETLLDRLENGLGGEVVANVPGLMELNSDAGAFVVGFDIAPEAQQAFDGVLFEGGERVTIRAGFEDEGETVYSLELRLRDTGALVWAHCEASSDTEGCSGEGWRIAPDSGQTCSPPIEGPCGPPRWLGLTLERSGDGTTLFPGEIDVQDNTVKWALDASRAEPGCSPGALAGFIAVLP